MLGKKSLLFGHSRFWFHLVSRFSECSVFNVTVYANSICVSVSLLASSSVLRYVLHIYLKKLSETVSWKQLCVSELVVLLRTRFVC